MRLLPLLLASLIATFAVACGGSDDKPASTPTPQATATPAPSATATRPAGTPVSPAATPRPTATPLPPTPTPRPLAQTQEKPAPLVFASYFIPASEGIGGRGFVLAEVVNPGQTTLANVKVHLELKGASGRTLGTTSMAQRDITTPPIGPGASYLVLGSFLPGGFGTKCEMQWSDGGEPVSFTATLADPGAFVQGPGAQVPSRDVAVTPGSKPGTYKITGTLMPAETVPFLNRGRYAIVVLRDAANRIVGFTPYGNFEVPNTATQASANTPLKFASDDVPTRGTPVRAEVNYYNPDGDLCGN